MVTTFDGGNLAAAKGAKNNPQNSPQNRAGRPGLLRIVVRLPDGKPAADAKVRISSRGRQPVTGNTNADGVLEVDLPAGAYEVGARTSKGIHGKSKAVVAAEIKSRVVVELERNGAGPATQPSHKHNRKANPAAPAN
jgi:hypothetical protein